MILVFSWLVTFPQSSHHPGYTVLHISERVLRRALRLQQATIGSLGRSRHSQYRPVQRARKGEGLVQAFSFLLNTRILRRRVVVTNGTYSHGSERTTYVLSVFLSSPNFILRRGAPSCPSLGV